MLSEFLLREIVTVGRVCALLDFPINEGQLDSLSVPHISTFQAEDIRDWKMGLVGGVKRLSGASNEDEAFERHLALRFLTASGADEWGRAREHWCIMADVDPDMLRDQIVRVLDGEREIDIEDRTYRLNGHDIARRLWANEKARHVAYI